jgi:Nucleotidyltransferase substrate binding protein like
LIRKTSDNPPCASQLENVKPEAMSEDIRQVWINMLDNRNLLSHTHDCSVFEQAVEAIAKHYLPVMENLHQFFVTKNAE